MAADGCRWLPFDGSGEPRSGGPVVAARPFGSGGPRSFHSRRAPGPARAFARPGRFDHRRPLPARLGAAGGRSVGSVVAARPGRIVPDPLIGPAGRSGTGLAAGPEHRGPVPLPTLPGQPVGAHDPPPSFLPVSRAASRWRCSTVRLATKSASGSAAGAFSFFGSLVQAAVQSSEGVDVTSDGFSLTIDDSLVCNQEVAGSIPVVSTKLLILSAGAPHGLSSWTRGTRHLCSSEVGRLGGTAISCLEIDRHRLQDRQRQPHRR